MVKLNEDLKYAKVFLDNAGVLERNIFEVLLKKLDKVLTRMEEVRLQINIGKSKHVVKEAKYLEYIVTTEEYSPDPKKIKGLLQIKALKNKRQVCKFLGSTNFHGKM